MTDAIYSTHELAQIRAYKDPIYCFVAFQVVAGLAFWLIFLRFFVGPLYAWSERMTSGFDARFHWARRLPILRAFPAMLDRIWRGPGWGTALLFQFALTGINSALWAPATVYFGFVHEHRFGLSNETLSHFGWDFFKQLLLELALVTALVFGMLGLARRLPRWWLIMGLVGAVGLLFSAAIDPYRSRLFFDQTPLPQGEVRDAIAALMTRAQIDFKEVVVEKTLATTVRLQAYFGGKGPTRTIVLNDALLKELSTEEIVAVVGHEAGHVQESRWAGQLGATLALLGFLFLIERLFQLTARRSWWGITQRADVRALPLINLIFWLFTILTLPISGGFQRQRELEADRYALGLTRNTPAFVRMLIKAARVNKMDPDPPRWIVLEGWTHPPIRERLEAVERWKKPDGG